MSTFLCDSDSFNGAPTSNPAIHFTDAELLSQFITGNNSLEIAQSILDTKDYSLKALSRLSARELIRFHGIGNESANRIVALFELSRRTAVSTLGRKKILSGSDVFDMLYPTLGHLEHEELHAIFLNMSNSVIGSERISVGGQSSTPLDQRVVFRHAHLYKATAIILVHNHPSGSVAPSNPDITMTQAMVESGTILDLPILDHVIISSEGYYSFNDNGKI